jgi:hypothetical protein
MGVRAMAKLSGCEADITQYGHARGLGAIGLACNSSLWVYRGGQSAQFGCRAAEPGLCLKSPMLGQGRITLLHPDRLIRGLWRVLRNPSERLSLKLINLVRQSQNRTAPYRDDPHFYGDSKGGSRARQAYEATGEWPLTLRVLLDEPAQRLDASRHHATNHERPQQPAQQVRRHSDALS